MPPATAVRKGVKAKRIRGIFRALIRKVMLCKQLLTDIDNKIGFNPKRNVVILMRRKRNVSILTSTEKLLFEKPFAIRSVKDREILVKIVANLKCFQLFPPKVRARLVPFLQYMTIDMNRSVYRQGQKPVYIYFILTGEIVAYQMLEDPYSKKLYRKDEYIVTPGDILGYVPLYNKGTRAFDYVATKDTDVLFLDCDVVQEYLMPYLKKDIEAKFLATTQYDMLNSFDYAQKIFIALFGKLKEYQPMETIYYRDRGALNYVYFILSGQCMILQMLNLTKVVNEHNEKQYILNSLDNIQLDPVREVTQSTIRLLKGIKEQRLTLDIPGTGEPSKLSIQGSKFFASRTNHFIDVGTLGSGALFGLGEPMEDRAIMARSTVQCLLIPRFWLLSNNQNVGNMWNRLKLSLKSGIPSRDQLFQDFIIDKKWKEFKRNYLYETLDEARCRINPTKIDDIPLICRIIESNLEDMSDEE